MKTAKKLFSVLLTTCMVLTLLPATALADTPDPNFLVIHEGSAAVPCATLAAAVNLAVEGDTIQAQTNVNEEPIVSNIGIDKSITLDLNTHTVSLSAPSVTVLSVSDGGNLTVKNGTLNVGTSGTIPAIAVDGGSLTIAADNSAVINIGAMRNGLSVTGGGDATVTSVTTTGEGGAAVSAVGVSATDVDDPSHAAVLGNVNTALESETGSTDGTYGVVAKGGAAIEVGGNISLNIIGVAEGTDCAAAWATGVYKVDDNHSHDVYSVIDVTGDVSAASTYGGAYGALATQGGMIWVSGDASAKGVGTQNFNDVVAGAAAEDSWSQVMVSGDATANGIYVFGCLAKNNGIVQVVGDSYANGTAVAYGAAADGNGQPTWVFVEGVTKAVSDNTAYGAYAKNKGTVDLNGDLNVNARSSAYGGYAENNDSSDPPTYVSINGSATVTSEGQAVGGYAKPNSSVYLGGASPNPNVPTFRVTAGQTAYGTLAYGGAVDVQGNLVVTSDHDAVGIGAFGAGSATHAHAAVSYSGSDLVAGAWAANGGNAWLNGYFTALNPVIVVSDNLNPSQDTDPSYPNYYRYFDGANYTEGAAAVHIIRHCTVSGIVTDAGGVPIPDVTVWAYNEYFSAKTGSDGRYTINPAPVQPDYYSVPVTARVADRVLRQIGDIATAEDQTTTANFSNTSGFITTIDSSVINDKATLGLIGTDVTSSKEGVVLGYLDENNQTEQRWLVLTSVGAGSATVTIKDGSKEATIAVTVDAHGYLTIGTITKYTPPAFVSATDSSTANTTATLGLVGTSAVSSAPGVATASISNSNIAITSVGAGTATVTVTDASSHTATIAVTVSATGAITIGMITKYTAPSSNNDSSPSNGGTTTTTTPITTVSGSTATTTVTPTVSGDVATGSVTADQMSDALKKAQAAAGASGTPNVTIQVSGASGASSVGMTIPHASLQSLVSGGVGALTVSGPTGSVSFDAAALKTISDASGDVNVTIAKTDSSTLSDSARALVGSRPVFTFSVTSGGSAISQFGGDVTVSVPYTLAAGEDPNAIVIYYIAADGTPTLVPDARYDAATGTVVFTTTHFSTYAVGYNKVSFTDVASGAWYHDAVTFLAARGITSGTTATTFGPDTTLTRGQFITMLLRAYGGAAVTNPTDNFSDAGNTYYTGYLAAAKKLGITTGVGNNKFAPDQAITRQEMFTLLYNALKAFDKLPSGTSGKTLADFTDAGNVASWAADAMTALVKAGTVSGSNSKLNPTGTTTRAEMAQVLYNLLGK